LRHQDGLSITGPIGVDASLMTTASDARAASVQGNRERAPAIVDAVLKATLLLCCGLPLLWLLLQLVFNSQTLVELRIDSFRAHLLGRTLLYNGSAALIATLMGLPAGIVLGRGRGRSAGALWFVLPVSLLLPSLAYAYGWKQCFRIAEEYWTAHAFSMRNPFQMEPAGVADTMRCIWTLASWLWPLPAGVIGISLRRLSSNIQEQAMLDGALWRVTLRYLAPAIILSMCAVTVLAVQEFAVYEPTGISVVATEVRMVFETGAFSSPENPITQQMGLAGASTATPGQSARAAAAVATSIPLLLVVALLTLAAAWGSRRLSAAEEIDVGKHWPRTLDAHARLVALSWLFVFIAGALPMLSMAFSLKRAFDIGEIWREFSPQASGSLTIAAISGIVALAAALAASVRSSRYAIILPALSFLIGGQLLAIALIRIYNHRWLTWVYNGVPVVVMAYFARFGWLALSAGRSTWTAPWRQVREMASLDGAAPIRTTAAIIFPVAWPILAAASGLMMILSLTEVPATVLLSPQHPQPLIPMLMTWVHMQRYDSMIEASLLLCGIVVLLGAVVVALCWIGRQAFLLKAR
jgi:ABC-type Fe3+ transport system permease subunit